MEKKKVIFIGVIILVIVIIGIIVYAIVRKNKLNKNAAIVSAAIDGGIGVLGTDVDSLLVSTKADSYFSLSEADMKKLKDAKGSWYAPDHPEYIIQILSGKTKAQIKSIFNQFQSKFGIKFNDHLNSIFDDITGYDTKGYQSVMDLIRNAK